MSAASCSLQNITNQWAKSKVHISDVSLDQSSDLDNSILNDMQEKDEMIEKLLDLADSLRNNLEKEKQEKAQLEMTIRQDVCREYSEYSDELIENQKRIAAEYVEALTVIHEKKMENLEAKYECQIAELRSQLEEYDSCTDESSMSINKGNATINNEAFETSKLLFESPVTIAKTDPTTHTIIKSEPWDEDVLNQKEEIKSLQADLSLVTKELEMTKEQLEQACEKLKEAETEAASVKEECISLSQKLQNAEEISSDCAKELHAIKAESLKKIEEIEILKKEKKNLEENIIFSSEEMVVAETEIEQLKKEKIDAEEQFAQQSNQFQQRISDAMQEYENLRLKLDKTLGDLVEADSKYEKMGSECENLKNHNSKLLGECQTLEDKLAQLIKSQADEGDKYTELELELKKANTIVDSHKKEISKQTEDLKILEEKTVLGDKQSVVAETAIEQLKKEKIDNEEQFAQQSKQFQQKIDAAELKCQEMTRELEFVNKRILDQETKINQLEKDCVNLRNINADLSTNCEIEKEKYTDLLAKHDSNETDLKCQELSNQLEGVNKIIKDQVSKISKLEEECAVLKCKNTELSTSYNIEKEKCTVLSEEHDNASVQIKHLEKELSEAMNAELKKNNDLKLEKEMVQEKYNELLPRFEEQSSKISKLESDCSKYQLENEQHLKAIKKFEESAISTENFGTGDGLDLKSQLDELQTERDNLKSGYDSVYENYQTLDTAFTALSKDIGSVRTDYEQLKQEKLDEADVYAKSIEELKNKNESFSKDIDELSNRLNEAQMKIAKYEEDISQLRSEYTVLKEKYSELEAANVALRGAENSKNEEIEAQVLKLKEAQIKIEECEKEILQMRTECLAVKEKCCELEVEKVGLQEIDSSKKEIEEELSEAQDKIKELENEVLHSSTECSSLKEKCSELEAENVALQGDESSKKEMEEQSFQLNEAQNKIDECKSKISQLSVEGTALKAKCSELETENVKLQAKLKEIQAKNLKDTNEFTSIIAELEKTISTNKDIVKELTENIETLEKYKTDITIYEEEILSAKEEIVNLKRELQNAKLLQEQSDQLCLSLEKCEWLASNKVKLLQSSTISSEEVADLRRQIKEKSNSIAELEKALCARQKQVKEMDVKMTEQVTESKRNSAVIEQLQHEKKLLDAEIFKMKLNQQQSTTNLIKEREKRKDVNEKVKKKRSLSDANMDTDEISVNKDNSNTKSTESKDKDNVKTEEHEDEIEVLSKRRRVLRSKQAKYTENLEDSVVEIKSTVDDDYEPSKKTANRKKKAASKVVAPPKTRISRKKLQEQENVSPVKKAMQFVGSKLLSVAHTVSPRVTRGRKKLFNNDADPKKAEPKWKI